MNKRVTSPGSFTLLLGTQPYGYDPTWRVFPRPPVITSVRLGVITKGNDMRNGNLVATAPPVGCSGSFTVADNDFTTGNMEIVIKTIRLQSYLDFAIGALVADTAANIVTAVNGMTAITGVSAENLGAVVTLTSSETTGDVVFRAYHYGTIVNLTPFVPADGYMAEGDPAIGAVELA